MTERKSRYNAIVDGREYTIVGPKSQEHMKTVSDIVNDQMETLKKLTRGMDRETRAVLLALNSVSDQVELQKKVQELEEKIENLKQNKQNEEFE